MMMMLLSFPLLLEKEFNIKPYIHSKKIRWSVLFIICGFLLKFIDHGYYQLDKEWSNYKSYNTIRGKLHDNPNLSSMIDSSSSTGLTATDISLFSLFLIIRKNYQN